MRVFAGLLIFVACVLIALGRREIRRARRRATAENPLRAKRLFGWFLFIAGTLFMILGIIAW